MALIDAGPVPRAVVCLDVHLGRFNSAVLLRRAIGDARSRGGRARSSLPLAPRDSRCSLSPCRRILRLVQLLE